MMLDLTYPPQWLEYDVQVRYLVHQANQILTID